MKIPIITINGELVDLNQPGLELRYRPETGWYLAELLNNGFQYFAYDHEMKIKFIDAIAHDNKPVDHIFTRVKLEDHSRASGKLKKDYFVSYIDGTEKKIGKKIYMELADELAYQEVQK